MALPSDPVFALSQDFVDAYSKACPVAASTAGVPKLLDTWDDYSPAGGESVLSLLRTTALDLAALPPAEERYGQLARRVLADFLEERAAYYEQGDHLCDLNNIESPLQHLRVVFDVMDTSTKAGWEAVATRLSTVGGAMAGYREALEEGVRRGLVAARRQVQAGLAQARIHASDKSSFYGILAAYDEANIGDAALRARIAEGVEVARRTYAEMATWLEGYLASATPRDAFGRERYQRSAKRFLGLGIDPMETYAWGFAEIRQIEAAMKQIAARIAPGKTPAELIASLQAAPDQLVADPQEFLRLMRERQERALSELQGTHFEVPAPIRTLEVKLAPTGTALGAYYIPPSEGFVRAGTVYYAPPEGKPFTLFSEITTAYHEGFPGHHLQCGLQVYLADRLSQFHRLFVVCSGYAEGWALYAEQLMDELGYFDKPEYVLGMHMAKLFRACRVVADIGAHLELRIPDDFDFHPGETWTWDLVVELMHERAFLGREFAESEATRYLGWAGQAISYKVGERVILDLRRELKEKLGPKFDLRAFHEAVLNSGSVGLGHMQDIVREALL